MPQNQTAAIVGWLILLGILSAIALIVVGVVAYYASDRAKGQQLMGAGGSVAVWTIIFVAITGVVLAFGQPGQTDAIWNLALLLLMLVGTGFIVRKCRPRQ
jgi:hypothetical protein